MQEHHIHERHNHSHGHEGHNHGAVVALTHINNAFVIGIVLNLIYVIVQIIIGLQIQSLSLLSDAGHNFLDVGALALSLLAFKLNKARATENFTYGYRKSSILISFFNAIVLLISIGAIGYESIYRFQHPQPLPGFTISIVAAIGIIVNGVSAFMFFRNKEKDMNVKAAFLHLLADALVSFGLVLGGIIIHFTALYWIDPVLSLIVCAVIIASTWSLLKGSLRLSLDGVPENININKIKEGALKISGILEIHHIHVWAISTTENALTAHLKVNKDATMPQIQLIKKQFKHELEHQNINHATLEVEADDVNCEAMDC